MMMGIEQFKVAARWAMRDHYQRTGEIADLESAELTLTCWEDGQTALRITLVTGETWEFAFDALAADIRARKAARH